MPTKKPTKRKKQVLKEGQLPPPSWINTRPVRISVELIQHIEKLKAKNETLSAFLTKALLPNRK